MSGRHRLMEYASIFAIGVALGLLPFGWLRLPVVMISLALLALFAGAIERGASERNDQS